MRYSIEPKFRKYVKGYDFLLFAKKFGNKYGKKLMDTATKTGIDAAKTTSKRMVKKTAEATGDLIGNKTNFLDITPDKKDLPRFVTKIWIEVYNQSEGNYDVNKETRI